MHNLMLHPLCTLFPRLDAAEFDALADDIAANGLMNPIVLLDGMILDGGNRYEACMAAGVEPRFVEFSGSSPVAFVLSSNLHRRHLSAGQQAAIVASAKDWSGAHGHGGDRKSDQAAILPLETVADRASQSGASERTQRMADQVVKADPELGKRVAHGEVSLPKAVEQVTGKRPGSRKPRPVDSSVLPASADDGSGSVDLLHDLEAADKEIRRLTAIVQSLESSDQGREIVLLHDRVAGLEGRLRQESTSLAEAKKDARWAQELLRKIMKRLNVEKFSDILGALPE